MYNLKITTSEDKENPVNRNSSSRPSAPRGDKDFKKILSDKDNKQGDEEDNESQKNAKFSAALDGVIEYSEVAYLEEKPKKQPSLFDLSKKPVKKNDSEETEEVAKMASSDEMPTESPNSIFKSLTLKEKAGKQEDVEDKYGKLDKKEDLNTKTPNRFPQESVDLSYVNPLALSTKAVDEIGDQGLQKTLASQRLTTQELVDALVKAITTAESQGKSDTIVTLKQPPMFEGSNIVLTSYESAKGEFNIRFENLSQQAKAFMDMQQNQDALLSNLQQKGYAVHILVATTQIETPIASAQQASQSQNQQQNQQEQGQGQNRRRPKDEEEA